MKNKLEVIIDKKIDDINEQINKSEPFSQNFMNLLERRNKLKKAKLTLKDEGILIVDDNCKYSEDNMRTALEWGMNIGEKSITYDEKQFNELLNICN